MNHTHAIITINIWGDEEVDSAMYHQHIVQSSEKDGDTVCGGMDIPAALLEHEEFSGSIKDTLAKNNLTPDQIHCLVSANLPYPALAVLLFELNQLKIPFEVQASIPMYESTETTSEDGRRTFSSHRKPSGKWATIANVTC